MTGHELTRYRKQSGLTQAKAARRLGVSQAYLSLLEGGERPLTDQLVRRAVSAFDLEPTKLPANAASFQVALTSDDQLTSDLAMLGYLGFSHWKRSRTKNPADVLLSALKADRRDARLVEALPWLVLNFPDLDWKYVVMTAKAHDLQNRLGFVTNVANRMAERYGKMRSARKLKTVEASLENSKLEREETLCKETMTRAEREWLKAHRPDEAKHWNLLTDLVPQHLNSEYYVTA